jgi:hypothetical protein
MSCDPNDFFTREGSGTGAASRRAFWEAAGAPFALLPVDSAARKGVPLARGLLDYFPAALAAVAELSRIGNDKHNPGQPLHWSRWKSADHADCIVRHLIERGHTDTDGLSHTVKVAWRALALLQEELEAAGASLARGARADGTGATGTGGTSAVQPEGWYARGCHVPEAP